MDGEDGAQNSGSKVHWPRGLAMYMSIYAHTPVRKDAIGLPAYDCCTNAVVGIQEYTIVLCWSISLL